MLSSLWAGGPIVSQIEMKIRHSKRLARRFIRAVKRGDLGAAKALLIRGADANARAPSGWSAPGKTALMLAIVSGSPGLVSLLLDRGAYVYAAGGQEQRTALMVAVEKGDAVLVQLSLDRGAMVNATARDDWTAMLLAVRAGDRGMIEILLAAGADVSAKASSWDFPYTPLGFAAATLSNLRQELRFLGEEQSKRRSATLRAERKWEAILRLLQQADTRE